jgi:hypothetical protein
MGDLILTKHAKKRMIERSKIASFMKPSELNSLIANATEFTKEVGRNHGFEAKYYLIESIELILVVNPQNKKIVTVYKKDSLS